MTNESKNPAKIDETHRVPLPLKWIPYHWLPTTRLNVLGVSIIALLLHFSLLFIYDHAARYATNEWTAGIILAVSLLVNLLSGLFMATTQRRMVVVLDPAWEDLFCLTFITLIICVVISPAVASAIEQLPGDLRWGRLFYGTWLLLFGFGLKPALDHVLDKLHPRGPLSH